MYYFFVIEVKKKYWSYGGTRFVDVKTDVQVQQDVREKNHYIEVSRIQCFVLH